MPARGPARITSPNANARRSVQGEYVDPRTNEVVRTTDSLAADHIIPQRFIRQLDGFDQLTREQKAAVLNYADNFQGLPRTFNSSKGGTLPAEWSQYRGQPLDAAYVARNRALQPGLLERLEKMIEDYRKSNAGR
jgi:filamentous hemagglutinin